MFIVNWSFKLRLETSPAHQGASGAIFFGSRPTDRNEVCDQPTKDGLIEGALPERGFLEFRETEREREFLV